MIGSIYDCSLDPSCWPSTLMALRRGLDAHNASLSLVDMQSGAIHLNIASGIEGIWLDRLGDYTLDVLEQWGGYAKVQSYPVGEPLLLSEVNSDGLTDKNRYVREWGKPQGVIDTMAFVLARDTTSIGTLGLGRHKSAGPFSATDIELARLLAPHLQRAVAITRLLDVKAVTAATCAAVLDTLAVSVIVTDVHLALVHANAAAEGMLRLGDPVRVKAGTVSARSTGVASALAVAVTQAARDECAIARKGLGVPAQGEDGRAYVLHVLPLRFGAFRPTLMPSAVAAIFVSPAVAPLPAPKAALAALFDLTPMEAQVLEHIAAGRTRADTARALGVGFSTLKTHLLHLFEKTGCHRQADLVALAASFALPLRADGLKLCRM
jgi:DNA-binding CsgD family transcriptional regulator